MNIAVVGLGIIGGSFCKAIKKCTDHRVIGINRTKSTAEKALKEGAIDEIGTHESLENADLIILSMYPQAVVDYVARYGEHIKKGAVVTDVSGIKRAICPQMTKLSEKFGFVFAGSHPMAGKETNGFDVSDADLYKNASYIIVPCKADNSVVNMLSDFAKSIGFGTVKITTPEEHDRMIAFTSQLPHVLACSYVLSPCCPNHKGFSAGSYRDVSRVANINSTLWSELFLENKDPLVSELDILIDNITKIKDAISAEDADALKALLEKGREVKQALGE